MAILLNLVKNENAILSFQITLFSISNNCIFGHCVGFAMSVQFEK